MQAANEVLAPLGADISASVNLDPDGTFPAHAPNPEDGFAPSGPLVKAALLKAQRAWIAFRDADCATVRALSGGTIAPIYVQNCYLQHTARRAQALEDLLKP